MDRPPGTDPRSNAAGVLRFAAVAVVGVAGALPLGSVMWKWGGGPAVADHTTTFLDAVRQTSAVPDEYLIPDPDPLAVQQLKFLLMSGEPRMVGQIVQGPHAESTVELQLRAAPAGVTGRVALPDPWLAVLSPAGGLVARPPPLPTTIRLGLQWTRVSGGWRLRGYKIGSAAGERTISLDRATPPPGLAFGGWDFDGLRGLDARAADRLIEGWAAGPPPAERFAVAATRAGPVVVSVLGINETPRTGTGSLTLACGVELSTRLPAGARLDADTPTVIAVEGPDGQDLLRTPLQPPPVPAAPASGTPQRSVPLKNLLADVDAVTAVRGTVRVLIPEAVEGGRLRREVGETVSGGGARLRVRSLPPVAPAAPGDGDRWAVEVEGDRRTRAAYWRAVDTDGRTIAIGDVFPLRAGSADLRVPAATVGVEVKVVVYRSVEFPFAFHHLRLPTRPPRALAPAVFGADGPATAAYDPAADRPRWVVTNRADKAIETVLVEVTYPDPADGSAKRWSGPLSQFTPLFDASRPAAYEPGLPAGRTAHVPAEKVSLPAGVTPTGVRVLAVEFVDATVWRAAAPSR